MCWDDQTRAMFDKAFLSTHPTDRPSAAEWENHLRGLVQHRQFKVCENYPNDASHIHFVGKPCHRCLFLTVPNNPLTTPVTPVPVISAAAATSVWQTTPTRASVASTAANHPSHQSNQQPSAALSGLMNDETWQTFVGGNRSAQATVTHGHIEPTHQFSQCKCSQCSR